MSVKIFRNKTKCRVMSESGPMSQNNFSMSREDRTNMPLGSVSDESLIVEYDLLHGLSSFFNQTSSKTSCLDLMVKFYF